MSIPVLEIRNLFFSWSAEAAPVLGGIDLALAPHETLGLCGGNGSGKTTLFRCITGLLKPLRGEIYFKNRPVRTEKDYQLLRLQVGFVLQSSEEQIIFPTVLEDVCFGPLNQGLSQTEALDRAKKTLDLLELTKFENHLTTQLSGGELRMVALAGILAMQPAVLLLDEPFTGLDASACARLQAVLGKLSCAIILVAHEPGYLNNLCSRLVELKNGKLISIA